MLRVGPRFIARRSCEYGGCPFDHVGVYSQARNQHLEFQGIARHTEIKSGTMEDIT